MIHNRFKHIVTVAAGILIAPQPLVAQDAGGVSMDSREDQFDRLSALVGEWSTEEHENLRIVFEPTAAGSVIIERWMVGERTHSLTLYHRDGSRVLATHYCPQGNQPRLESLPGEGHDVAFTFADATDLDAGESYAHDLSFRWQADGSLRRSETYHGEDGAGEPSALTLRPAG